jgi:hypothetical protein
LCIILVNFEKKLQRKETEKCNLGDCILTLIFLISLLLPGGFACLHPSPGFALEPIGGLDVPQTRFAPPPKKSGYGPAMRDVIDSTIELKNLS